MYGPTQVPQPHNRLQEKQRHPSQVHQLWRSASTRMDEEVEDTNQLGENIADMHNREKKPTGESTKHNWPGHKLERHRQKPKYRL